MVNTKFEIAQWLRKIDFFLTITDHPLRVFPELELIKKINHPQNRLSIVVTLHANERVSEMCICLDDAHDDIIDKSNLKINICVHAKWSHMTENRF